MADSFEKYFLHLPPFDRAKDFSSFWEKSIADFKKNPINPDFQKEKKPEDRFLSYRVTYSGFLKTGITGELLVPAKGKKPKVIIDIHDYNSTTRFRRDRLDNRFAYLFLKLRGHDRIQTNKEGEQKSPGFMIEHILDINTYYVKAAFLDVYRSIDVLRLNKDLDCSIIGLLGKGFGAAAALFTGAFSDRVKALVLETPSFSYLPLGQNISTGDAAEEINEFIYSRKGKKKVVKDNLTYFDAINFSDRISQPVLATVGLKDTISPPQCVFALFNHLECEKTIEVYPEEGNEAGGTEQFKKSLQWLGERMLS
jgi:cephalosporin-C deacetylase-like acetyl esterase